MQAQSAPTATPPFPPVPPFPPDFPGRTMTMREIRAVRSDLSDQLISVRDRRGEVVASLRRASDAERPGLEQHLRVLDDRINRIEGDLERTGQMLTSGNFSPETGMLVPPQNPIENIPPGGLTAIGIVFTLFVLAPIALSFARLIWRRATARQVTAPAWDSSQRMDRLEHAVDSIAVEVERISEGQRFVTRLLTESPNFGQLNSGQKVGEQSPQREAVKVPREQR